MPRPSRARRILKWTSVGLFIALSTFWVVAMRYSVGIALPAKIEVGTGDGVFWISESFDDSWKVWCEEGPNWVPGFVWPVIQANAGGPSFVWGIPFWLLLLITAIPTAWLWHRDRRRIRPGCCLRCGYDLTGNTSGVCSECGLAKPPPAIV